MSRRPAWFSCAKRGRRPGESEAAEDLRGSNDVTTKLPYLWVRRRALEGEPYAVEILATDGDVLRRVAMGERQIYIQETRGPLAAGLVSHIEEGLHRGQALVGYSNLEGEGDVCLRITGAEGEPGWLAFRDTRGVKKSMLRALDDLPRRRLVAGASPRWRPGRKYFLYVAMEERGADVLPGLLASQVEEVEVALTRKIDGRRQLRRLPEAPWVAERFRRESDEKVDCRIPLKDQTFNSLLSAPEAEFWLRVRFSQEVLCLPKAWRQLHLHIRPQ